MPYTFFPFSLVRDKEKFSYLLPAPVSGNGRQGTKSMVLEGGAAAGSSEPGSSFPWTVRKIRGLREARFP